MLSDEDLTKLQLHMAQGLKEQLTHQVSNPLYLIKPDEPSVSDQYETAIKILEEQESELTKKLNKILD
jgi:hypothetical protein